MQKKTRNKFCFQGFPNDFYQYLPGTVQVISVSLKNMGEPTQQTSSVLTLLQPLWVGYRRPRCCQLCTGSPLLFHFLQLELQITTLATSSLPNSFWKSPRLFKALLHVNLSWEFSSNKTKLQILKLLAPNWMIQFLKAMNTQQLTFKAHCSLQVILKLVHRRCQNTHCSQKIF